MGQPVSEKNRTQWSLPLEEFIVYSPELSNYAEQLLISKCLTGQGYEWPVPWRDSAFLWPEGFNKIGYRLFDEPLAKRFGYHFAPPRDANEADAWAAFADFANSYTPDDDFTGKFEECSDEARSEKTVRDVDAQNYVMGLAMQASDVAVQDASVQEAVARWRECLTPKVDFAVSDTPWKQMPPQAVAERFGLYGESRTMAASGDEIAVAVADAQCRESSGVSETRYNLEWDQQKKLMDQNRDQLDRIRAEAGAHKKDLLAIIAENAPAAPMG